ncbi:tetratricopeptide repeat protein [Bacteroides fragilis]|uniref:tetratricopeptide repeat protein n=1 Tax=Bacteroides fragilis TaxID=817 RepID=UPI00202FB2D9|nr:tetratricopeptide repeat protein [Bacteroides fragilis]MCM0301931.1 tetratricopeptide repeat protein [Bacteroides fragilis]
MRSNKDTFLFCIKVVPFIALICWGISFLLPDSDGGWFVSITTSLLCGIIVSMILAAKTYVCERNRLTKELYNAIIDVVIRTYPLKQYSSHCLIKTNINSILLSRDAPQSIQEIQRLIDLIDTDFAKIQDIELYTITKKASFRNIYGNAYASTRRIIQDTKIKGLTTLNSYYKYRNLRINPDRNEQDFEEEKNEFIKFLSGFETYLNSAMSDLSSQLQILSNLLKLGKKEVWEHRAKEIDNYYSQKQISPEPIYNSIFQIETMKGQALMYCNESKYEEALKICIQIENIYIHELSTIQKTYIYWIAGISYMELGKTDAAINYIERYKSIFTNSTEALDKLGLLYIKNKMPLKAIECYENIVQINEQLFFYWKQLGILYSEVVDYDKAIYSYKKAIEFDSIINETIYSNLIELLIFKRRFIEAQRYLSELGRAFPHNFNYLYLRTIFEITTTPKGGNANKLFKRLINSYQPQEIPISWKFSDVQNWLKNDSTVFLSKEQRKALIEIIDKLEKWRG